MRRVCASVSGAWLVHWRRAAACAYRENRVVNFQGKSDGRRRGAKSVRVRARLVGFVSRSNAQRTRRRGHEKTSGGAAQHSAVAPIVSGAQRSRRAARGWHVEAPPGPDLLPQAAGHRHRTALRQARRPLRHLRLLRTRALRRVAPARWRTHAAHCAARPRARSLARPPRAAGQAADAGACVRRVQLRQL